MTFPPETLCNTCAHNRGMSKPVDSQESTCIDCGDVANKQYQLALPPYDHNRVQY